MSSKHPQNDKLDLRRGFPEGLEMFDILEDPRRGNATLHPFGSLIFIALSAIICGMDTCEDFVRFAKARKKWLKKWVALPEGIPCANTFLRLFAVIDPAVFGECLGAYVTTLAPDLKARLHRDRLPRVVTGQGSPGLVGAAQLGSR